MKKIITKLINLMLKLIVLFINIFLPKKNEVVLIGGWFGERFADNSKYLYLYLNENKDKYQVKKIIFITRKKDIYRYIKEELNYEVYMMYSLGSFYYHIIARYYIVDQAPRKDLIGWLGINSIKINLWHGLPLKKIGYDKKIKKPIHIGNWQESYLLTCSEYGDKILGEAFKCPINKRLRGMYPRNYYLINENKYLSKIERELLKKIEKIKNENKKIIIYLPTFRDKNKLKFLGEEDKNKLIEFFRFLEENNYFLVSKEHFAGTSIFGENREIIYFSDRNFLNLESNIDIYPFLKISDILITDYSSVYFDYLYLDRDIIFYPYDLEYYRDKDRGLFFDYYKITPGNKVYTIEQLKEILKKLRYSRDNFRDDRKKLLEKCFENHTIDETVENIFKLK